ncbi:MAG: hypothetical protein ACI4DP_03795 [Candidatus Ornithomonoglobus sp.]
MTTIKGTHMKTINAAAGEIYEIEYSSAWRVDISNNTDSSILISTNGEFSEDGTAADYLELPSGFNYNNLAVTNTLYIKSNGTGKIMIVRCR